MANKNDYYINKWSFLLKGLSDKKSLKAKYAKIYEKSSLMNNFQDFKLVVSILYKVFSEVENIYISNSKKQSLKINQTYEYNLFDQDVILIDWFEKFVYETYQEIVNKINSGEIEKIHHLRINHENDLITVNVVY